MLARKDEIKIGQTFVLRDDGRTLANGSKIPEARLILEKKELTKEELELEILRRENKKLIASKSLPETERQRITKERKLGVEKIKLLEQKILIKKETEPIKITDDINREAIIDRIRKMAVLNNVTLEAKWEQKSTEQLNETLKGLREKGISTLKYPAMMFTNLTIGLSGAVEKMDDTTIKNTGISLKGFHANMQASHDELQDAYMEICMDNAEFVKKFFKPAMRVIAITGAAATGAAISNIGNRTGAKNFQLPQPSQLPTQPLISSTLSVEKK
jgi:hypothetical protein